MRETIRRAAAGSRYLLAGGVTGLGAATALTLVLVLVGATPPLGLLLLPAVVRANRWIAGVERRRAGELLGAPIADSYPPARASAGGSGLRVASRRWLTTTIDALVDRTTYRDLAWVTLHTVAGTLLALLTLVLWGWVVAVPVLPLAQFAPFGAVDPRSWWVVLLAPLPVLGLLVVTPWLAEVQARTAATLLGPPASHRLTARVAELTRSRAEALDAHGAELRRIERDLHDGAQARMVSVALLLGVAERRWDDDPAAVPALVRQAREGAEGALVELRALVRGMYPPILADRGLGGAIGALAAAAPVPVTVNVAAVGRLPAAVEAAAYLTVAEALTNIARHSRAGRASVVLRRERGVLVIGVDDDGVGGADESRGTGLLGIRRRIAAFDGRVALNSPPGGPTTLRVELPCAS